ncbi:MAG: TlpA family protein disulfide reductase [Bacteroidales bacterium]|nr:TlpA family protein disulfide reductase [Bacteroidales bacterium]
MRKIGYVIVLYFVIHSFEASGQNVVISGNAPSYAGTELIFMQYSDWITHSEEVVGTAGVDTTGEFYLEVTITGTELLFTYVGVYRAYFYAEQDRHYELILPEYTEKLPQERLNPYFQYEDVHIGIRNFDDNELNMLIMMFDDAYNPYYSKHVYDAYNKPDVTLLEKDIGQIEEPFLQYNNQFFKDYRYYVYGLLKMSANQQRVQSLSDEYFNNRPVLYDHPVYGELFNRVFDKYFIFYGRTEEGRKIYDDINQLGDYDALAGSVSKTNNFSNDTLQELVILKEMHDEYYSDQFSRKALLNILDTLIERTSIEEHRSIGQNIRNKITRLQAGFDPPQFELEDPDGNPVKLSDFVGRYVYLNFCTFQSYTCLNEFNMLASVHQKHGDKLSIITITTDPDSDEFRAFRSKNEYNWIFLHYDTYPEIIKQYDIRAFPTYFLIGPDGKLILSPAPSPAENFESRLFEIMRSRGDL